MKKYLLILAYSALCLGSPTRIEGKIVPYLKFARGTVTALGALYCASNAYSWHKHANSLDPQSAQATYARYRCYFSAAAAVILGISGFRAIEKSLEQLDK